MQVVGKIKLIQSARGVIENNGVPAGVRQSADSAVQPGDDFPARFRVARSHTEIHGKHRRRLHDEIGIGGLLQHITPDIGVVKQCIHLACAQRPDSGIHGVEQRDLDSGIQLLDDLGCRGDGSVHSHPQVLHRRELPVHDNQGKSRLNQIVRDYHPGAGGAFDHAAERHDHIVGLIVERILERALADNLEYRLVAGFFSGNPHQIDTDSGDLPCPLVLIKNRATVSRHANRERRGIAMLPGGKSDSTQTGQKCGQAKQGRQKSSYHSADFQGSTSLSHRSKREPARNTSPILKATLTIVPVQACSRHAHFRFSTSVQSAAVPPLLLAFSRV